MKNKRLFFAGLLAIAFGLAVFFGVRQIAPQSNDPAEVMRIAGQAAGVLAGIGLALVIMAFFVRPAKRR